MEIMLRLVMCAISKLARGDLKKTGSDGCLNLFFFNSCLKFHGASGSCNPFQY